MLMLVLLFTLVAAFCWFSTKKPAGYPPGPTKWPILGYGLFIEKGKPHRTWEFLQRKYGSVVGIFVGSDPLVIVNGWEAGNEALANPDLLGRPELFSNEDLYGKHLGIMFSNGEFWKTQRRFTLHHLRNLGVGKSVHHDIILEEVRELIQHLNKKNGPFEIQPELAVTGVTVLWAVLAGVRLRHDDPKLYELVQLLDTAFRTSQIAGGLLNTFPFLRKICPEFVGYTPQLKAFTEVKNYVEKAIEDHKKDLDQSDLNNFIDLYLNELKKTDLHSSFSARLVKTSAFLTEVMRFRCVAPVTVPHTCTNDTILQVRLRFKYGFDFNNSLYLKAAGGLLNIFPFLRKIFPDFLGYTPQLKALTDVKNYVEKAIEDHKKDLDQSDLNNFIDLYLNELKKTDLHSSFSESQLTAVCNDLFTAGSETSSSVVGFCVLFLCLHPDWQAAVQKELDQHLKDTGRDLPTIEDRNKLVKTSAFLTEVMRFRCVAPVTVPHTCTNDTILQGHRIPKNATLFVNLRSIMMDESYWGDPFVFRPDRFIADDGTIFAFSFVASFTTPHRGGNIR
ncbi:methyl farnesoate epoxidase-like, partial [Hyalella azteca]|uniref:Methyl farnesoate epoxidase-like n=1 Tax=Hyalella azteca TaxID=294128 RepID=A0A8B7P2B6_HYAAZ